MKLLFFSSVFFILFSHFSFANALEKNYSALLEKAKKTCRPVENYVLPKKELYLDVDIHSGQPVDLSMGLDLIKSIFKRQYDSQMHTLPHRAYYSPQKGSFVLPYANSFSDNKPLIPLTDNFIINVMIHIELSLKGGYAEHISYSDFGHAHTLIPLDYYENHLRNITFTEEGWLYIYEKIFSLKESKFLYHSAERVRTKNENQFISDHLKTRYLNRNIVGDNNQLKTLEIIQPQRKNKGNTAQHLDGYRYWTGFYIHSNKNGCFPYEKNGKTYYFDISLKTFEEQDEFSTDP